MTSPQATRQQLDATPLGIAAATWGALGVVALLTQAIIRLLPRALEPLENNMLDAAHGGAYAGWVVFSLYFEGYRAFQKRFSPRVVARAFHLARNPSPWHVALAPLFCMALFHARRRATTLARGTVVMVICFIVALRHVPQPYRGIIDGGVVAALVWGAIAIVYYFVRALFGEAVPASPETPDAPPLLSS